MTAIHAPGVAPPMSPRRATARWILILIIFLPGFAATAYAQSSSPTAQATPYAAVNVGADVDTSAVELLVGRSAVLNIPTPITRVSLTSPDIADALVTTTQQVLVHGKTPGTISMFVWDRAGAIRRYEVVVRRDLSELQAQLHQLFPNEPIAVSSNGSHVLLSGMVSSKPVIDRAGDVAAGYVPKKEDVVNLLQQPVGVGSNQVLLRVRFAEVARTALSELGVSLFSDGRENQFARTTTQQFSAPVFSEPDAIMGKTLVFSDYLNLFLFDAKNQLGAVVRALSNRGLFQSLAEPNLIAQDGKEASFLAGGEYPYPVVQGSGAGLAVTIQFKEFGVKLNFTPTMLGGDLIHLKVRPEVSALDFTNALSVQGFRIPTLSTRRAETELELHDGQTFAIAGLLNNTVTSTMQKIPGIGDIPILGLLFKSRAARKEQTELVVMITPQIMRPTSPGAASGLPGMVQPYLPPVPKPIPMPPPYGPQGSVAPGTPGGAQANAPVTSAPAPAAVLPIVTPATTSSSAAQPVVSTPVVQPAASKGAVVPAAPVTATAAKPTKPTKEARQAMEREQKEQLVRQAESARVSLAEEKRAAEAAKVEAKRAAAQAKVDARRAAELKQQQEREAQAQAIENAKASQQAEAERKKREEAERKRGKEIAEAEARLKAAQAAYEEQLKHSSSQNQQ